MKILRRFLAKRNKSSTKSKVEVSIKVEFSGGEGRYLLDNNEIDPIYKEKVAGDLRAGEVILLEWLENKKTIITDYPKYFLYEYGIDPVKSTAMLHNSGYLGVSLQSSLAGLKVDELKAVLKANNLPVAGKKSDLIDRINDNVSADDLKECIESRFFSRTNLGEELISQNTYILFAHANRSKMFTVAEAIRFMKRQRGKGVKTINQFSAELIIEKIKGEFKNKNYGLMRNCFLSLGDLYEKNRDDDKSITAYICMYIFDVSGWSNGNDYHENNVFNEATATVVRRVIRSEIDDVRLEGYFLRAWEMTGSFFPRHYLGKSKSFECLVAIFKNDSVTVNKLLNFDNRVKRDFSIY